MKIFLGLLALLFGAAFAVGEIWGVWEYMLKEQGGFNYLVGMGLLVAGAFAFLPAWAALAWRDSWSLSAGLWACWVVAGVVVVGAALVRTGSAVDDAQLQREKAATEHRIAEQAERGASRQLATDEATVEMECRTGNGPKCQNARAARDATQGRLDEARRQLLAARGSPGDALARRLAATGYVTEQQVRNVQPLLVPLLGSALSAFLISLGVGLLGGGKSPETKVLPGDDKNSIQPEPVADRNGLAAPDAKVAHLAKVVPIQQRKITEGEVTKFMLARMPAEPGARAEIADVYAAYLAWCVEVAAEPIAAKRFAATFTEICKRADIQTSRKGGKVYAIGRRLAS